MLATLALTVMVEIIDSRTDNKHSYIHINNGECVVKVEKKKLNNFSYVDREMLKQCGEIYGFTTQKN